MAAKPEDVGVDAIITTESSITLNIDTADTGKMNQEYSIDGGNTWVSPDPYNGKVVFNGLTANTPYTIKAQVKATDTAPKSEMTAGVTIKTDLVSVIVSTKNYSKTYDGNPLSALIARKKGGGDTAPSDPTEPVTVTTTKADQGKPEHPAAVARSYDQIEIDPAYSEMEYICIPKSATDPADTDWSAAKMPDESGKVIFENLKENTEYSVYARMKESDTHNASPASDSMDVKTDDLITSALIAPNVPVKGDGLTVSYETQGNGTGYPTSYQWYRGDDPIAGEDSDHYMVTAEDVGKIIKVRVYQGDHYTETSVRVDGTYVSEPTEPETLTYNGSEQQLITAGTARNGRIEYAIGNDSSNEPLSGWSTSVPAAVDAGTYYVWYKAVGDTDSDDSDRGCVTVEVSAADPEMPSGLTATYGQALSDIALPVGWAWTDGVAVIGKIGTNSFKASYIPINTNYNSMTGVDISVVAGKADSATKIPPKAKALTYTCSEQELL